MQVIISICKSIFFCLVFAAAFAQESIALDQVKMSPEVIPIVTEDTHPEELYTVLDSRIKVLAPTTFGEWSLTQRERWLKEKKKSLGEEKDDDSYELKLDRYTVNRVLFEEYYFSEMREAAQKECRDNKPRKNDIFWRLNCVDILVDVHSYDISLNALESILADAEQLRDIEGTVLALNDRGWIESSNGMITEALLSYQKILDITPRKYSGFVYDAMMNTATTYIVHGNKEFIQKGIAMLLDIAHENIDELEGLPKLPEDERRGTLDTVAIAYFNIGIAYTLHLQEYDKAPEYFIEALSINRQNVIDSHVFLALAYANLGRFEEAKKSLANSQLESEPNKVKRAYLTCYQQIAISRWDSSVSMQPCYQMPLHTTVEVTRDIFGRLVESKDLVVKQKGFELFYQLFTTKIEPELKRRAARSASRNEMSRLQLESDLKSKLLEKEKVLKLAQQSQKEFQQIFLVSALVIAALALWLVLSSLRKKTQLTKTLRDLSLHDELTKLGNRRYLVEYIDREVAVTRRESEHGTPIYLGVLILDIDFFKRINDDFGHQVGDDVLVEFARRLKQTCRDSDLLVRWGGEEFVLISRVKNDFELERIARRINATIASQVFTMKHELNIPVTCTVGAMSCQFLSSLTEPKQSFSDEWETAIALADLALYWGKENRRNSWNIIFNINIENHIELKQLLSSDLNRAIQKKRVKIDSRHISV